MGVTSEQLALIQGSGGLSVVQGALTDRSVTCTGANQTLMAANATRNYLLIQNKSGAAGSFWISFDDVDAVADSPSIEFVPGLLLTWEGRFIPNGKIEVIGATGLKVTAKEA